MSKKKGDSTIRKSPSTSTSSGMDDAKKMEAGVKKKAPYPGDSENAAGTDNNEKGNFTKIGSPPISNESVNTGEKKKE